MPNQRQRWNGRDERLRMQREEREQEQHQQYEAVISEFDAGDPDATMRNMAAEILTYRRAIRLLSAAADWAQNRAPFGMIGPGPLWQPKPPPATSESSKLIDAAVVKSSARNDP